MLGIGDANEGGELPSLLGSFRHETVPVNRHFPQLVGVAFIGGRSLLELDYIDRIIDVLSNIFVIDHFQGRYLTLFADTITDKLVEELVCLCVVKKEIR